MGSLSPSEILAADAAIKELDRLRKKPVKERLKDIARYASGRRVSPYDCIFWPSGLILLGLAELSQKLQETGVPEDDKLSVRMDMASAAFLEQWKDRKGGVFFHIDDCIAGAAMVLLSERGCLSDPFSREDGAPDRLYSYVRSLPADSAGTPLYNASSGNDYIFADGAGEAAVFLSVYAAVRNNSEASDLAAAILKEYRKNGMDVRTGLPYHAYSLREGKKLGIIGWGRAAGWLMLGLKYYLEYTADPEPELVSWYEELKVSVLSFRRDDGLFSWALPCLSGYADTSASCMLARSIPELSDEITDIIASSHLTANGEVTGALDGCEDLCVYRQRYGIYPWGQGSYLMALGVRSV